MTMRGKPSSKIFRFRFTKTHMTEDTKEKNKIEDNKKEKELNIEELKKPEQEKPILNELEECQKLKEEYLAG